MQCLVVGFLNAFIALLLVDGALSLVGRLAQGLIGFDPLQFLHGMTGLALVVWAPWTLLAVGLCWRVPPSAFLPGIVGIWWMTLGAMPLPVHLSFLDTLRIASVVELLLGAWAWWRIRRLTGSGWLDEAVLAPGWLRSGYSLAFLGTAAIVVPVATVGWVGWSVAYGISELTEGFVQLDRDGVQLAERRYERDGREVRLVGMMHIGEPDAYRDLFADLPVEGSIILAEGVRDSEGRIAASLDYGPTARRLGLTAQGPMEALTPIPVQNADVDVNAFSPLTLRLLDSALVFHGHGSWRQQLDAWRQMDRLLREQGGDPLPQLMNDLVDLRNEHLLGQIELAAPAHPHIVVPWGAYHMKGIEAGLLARGYTPAGERLRTFARWSTLWAAVGASSEPAL